MNHRERGRKGLSDKSTFYADHWSYVAGQQDRADELSKAKHLPPNESIFTVINEFIRFVVRGLVWLFMPSDSLTVACRRITNFVALFYLSKFVIYVGTFIFWANHRFSYIRMTDSWIREIIAAILAGIVLYFINKPKAGTIYEEDFSPKEKRSSYVLTVFKVIGMMCVMGLFYKLMYLIGGIAFDSMVGYNIHPWLRFII